MDWKKLLIVAIAVGGFCFVATPRSDAGVNVGIGIGLPVGIGYGYGYPYGGYCGPYGVSGYYGPRYGYYYAPTVVVRPRPRYYWRHGRRIYYGQPYRARHYRGYRYHR